jgi:hypothetical protein
MREHILRIVAALGIAVCATGCTEHAGPDIRVAVVSLDGEETRCVVAVQGSGVGCEPGDAFQMTPEIQDLAGRIAREVPCGSYRSDRLGEYCIMVHFQGETYAYLMTRLSGTRDAPALIRRVARLVECLNPVAPQRYEEMKKDNEARLLKLVSGNPSDGEWELETVLAFLHEYADIRLSVAWDQLREAGIGPETKVRIRKLDVAVGRMLDGVLRELGERSGRQLAYEVGSDGVRVSTAAGLDWTRRYEVPPPAASGPASQAGDAEEIRYRVLNGPLAVPFCLPIRHRQSVRVKTFGWGPDGSIGENTPQAVEDLWRDARAAADEIPSGLYWLYSGCRHEQAIELPGSKGIRTYVFANLPGTPRAPEKLLKMWARLTGMTNW